MPKRLSLTPAKKTEEDHLVAFIEAANSENEPKKATSHPWDSPLVRDDVLKMVSLRLKERHILQLQYLSEKTNLSQQEILRRVIIPYLESEVLKY